MVSTNTNDDVLIPTSAQLSQQLIDLIEIYKKDEKSGIHQTEYEQKIRDFLSSSNCKEYLNTPGEKINITPLMAACRSYLKTKYTQADQLLSMLIEHCSNFDSKTASNALIYTLKHSNVANFDRKIQIERINLLLKVFIVYSYFNTWSFFLFGCI